MKLAVLIGVLLNLGFFFWVRAVTPSAAAVPRGWTQATTQPATLTLLDSGDRRCLSLSVASGTAAHARVARLRRQGVTARPVRESRRVVDAYWVLLGGFASKAAAQAAAHRLQQGGVKDLYVLPASDTQRIRISVGLFRDADHALQRALQVRTLGFSPQVHERFRQVPRWVVQSLDTPRAQLALAMASAAPGLCARSGRASSS